MDVSRPYRAVSPGLDADVLVALSALAEPVSGRQLARSMEFGSQPAINSALDRLVRQGIVDRNVAPPSMFYALNRDHLAFGVVMAMADLRRELFHRIRIAVEAIGDPVVHASIFGSMARGDGDEESDIDLLIVWREAEYFDGREEVLTALEAHLERWTGNRVNIAELDQRRLLEHGLPSTSSFLTEVAQDSITIHGPPFDELLRRG